MVLSGVTPLDKICPLPSQIMTRRNLWEHDSSQVLAAERTMLSKLLRLLAETVTTVARALKIARVARSKDASKLCLIALSLAEGSTASMKAFAVSKRLLSVSDDTSGQSKEDTPAHLSAYRAIDTR
jgi:hypothetical protein